MSAFERCVRVNDFQDLLVTSAMGTIYRYSCFSASNRGDEIPRKATELYTDTCTIHSRNTQKCIRDKEKNDEQWNKCAMRQYYDNLLFSSPEP